MSGANYAQRRVPRAFFAFAFGPSERFVSTAVPAYAADKVASGQWAKGQSLELARKALLELLPQGRQTADNYLFSVLDDQARPVGTLWIAVNEQAGKC